MSMPQQLFTIDTTKPSVIHPQLNAVLEAVTSKGDKAHYAQ
jgi:hypothetical protein